MGDRAGDVEIEADRGGSAGVEGAEGDGQRGGQGRVVSDRSGSGEGAEVELIKADSIGWTGTGVLDLYIDIER